jgi:ABC-2 type transport system permease protein
MGLKHMVIKEMIHLRRDRRLLFLLLAMPLFQLVIFGYAAVLDVKEIPLAVCDQDLSQKSRDLIERFLASGYFVISSESTDPRDMERALDSSKAKVAILIPNGYGKRVWKMRRAEVQVLIDGSDPTIARVARNYVSQIIQISSMKEVERRMGILKAMGMPIRMPEVDLEARIWFNQEMKSVNYMIPGIIGVILMVIVMVPTSVSIVRERERGTMEFLISSPLKPYEIIIGKLVPYILVGLVDVLIVIFAGRFLFGVPMKGNFLLLFLLSGLLVLAASGIGIFVSTISSTIPQAMITLASLFIFPSILLSGFIFPIEAMPTPLRLLSYLVPLKYFLIISRSIFLKGAGINLLWDEALVLSAFGVGIFWMSVLRFRKKI